MFKSLLILCLGLSLVGCGGSGNSNSGNAGNTGNTGNDNTPTSITKDGHIISMNITGQDGIPVTTLFDERLISDKSLVISQLNGFMIHFNNPIKKQVDQSKITITVDANNSAQFDEGDYRLITGELAPSTGQNTTSWISTGYIIEYYDSGVLKAVTNSKDLEHRPNTTYISNLGGTIQFKTDIHKNKSVIKDSLLFHMNQFSDVPFFELRTIILGSLSADTPINVEVRDNASNSVDYFPGKDIFLPTTSKDLYLDLESYSLGHDDWVDIKAINKLH